MRILTITFAIYNVNMIQWTDNILKNQRKKRFCQHISSDTLSSLTHSFKHFNESVDQAFPKGVNQCAHLVHILEWAVLPLLCPSGIRFTNDFSITIQFEWKIHFTEFHPRITYRSQILHMPRQHSYVHVHTVMAIRGPSQYKDGVLPV